MKSLKREVTEKKKGPWGKPSARGKRNGWGGEPGGKTTRKGKIDEKKKSDKGTTPRGKGKKKSHWESLWWVIAMKARRHPPQPVRPAPGSSRMGRRGPGVRGKRIHERTIGSPVEASSDKTDSI